MLNKAERFRVLKLFRICCIGGLLPIEVDLDSWRLKLPWIGKRWICFLFGFILALHAIYKNGSLVHAFFFDPNVQYHQLVIHAVIAVGSMMCVIFYERLYISNPDLFGKYARMTLLGNVGGYSDASEEEDQNRTRRLREYSPQDLIASSLPYMYTLAIPFMVGSYVYDPSMRLLVYNALPGHLQNWTTFTLCTLEEARFILVMVAVSNPVFQLQVLSYDIVSNQLQLLMRQIQNGVQSTRGVYMVLRNLQLYVSMANKLNGNLIFTCKLTFISMCILTGYSAVAHFHQHPIFGIMYYIIFFDVALNYTITYNKAFKIPELFDQAAAHALLRRRGKRTNDIFRRQILSIPRSGIKVGNFHRMERASTPILIDFVLKNIVNLLVAYG